MAPVTVHKQRCKLNRTKYTLISCTANNQDRKPLICMKTGHAGRGGGRLNANAAANRILRAGRESLDASGRGAKLLMIFSIRTHDSAARNAEPLEVLFNYSTGWPIKNLIHQDFATRRSSERGDENRFGRNFCHRLHPLCWFEPFKCTCIGIS